MDGWIISLGTAGLILILLLAAIALHYWDKSKSQGEILDHIRTFHTNCEKLPTVDHRCWACRQIDRLNEEPDAL